MENSQYSHLTLEKEKAPNFHPGKSYPGSCKPSITEVIGSRVQLRRAGKELIGLCPFHSEKTPSFSVSEDKGVFYCFGCQEGGDVLDFVMKADGLTFPQALAELGMKQSPLTGRARITYRQHQAAARAAEWMGEQRRKINVLLAEVLEQIELADEAGDSDLAESFLREQSFLRDLYEDLNMSRNAADLLSLRPMIEAITEGIEL